MHSVSLFLGILTLANFPSTLLALQRVSLSKCFVITHPDDFTTNIKPNYSTLRAFPCRWIDSINVHLSTTNSCENYDPFSEAQGKAPGAPSAWIYRRVSDLVIDFQNKDCTGKIKSSYERSQDCDLIGRYIGQGGGRAGRWEVNDNIVKGGSTCKSYKYRTPLANRLSSPRMVVTSGNGAKEVGGVAARVMAKAAVKVKSPPPGRKSGKRPHRSRRHGSSVLWNSLGPRAKKRVIAQLRGAKRGRRGRPRGRGRGRRPARRRGRGRRRR